MGRTGCGVRVSGRRRWRVWALCSVLAVAPLADAWAQVVCPLPAKDKADLFKNPFNRASAHHRPIGSGAVYAADSHPTTRNWLRSDHLNINPGNPSGTSVLEVSAADPWRVVNGAAACDRIVRMPVTIRLPAAGFLNNAVRPDGGCADNEVVIFDRGLPGVQDGVVHQLRQYQWNNGQPIAQRYDTWDIRGLGHGTVPGDMPGAAASGVAGLFGILRGHEINTPGYKITHALHIGLPRKSGTGCNVMLSREFVLPATSRDKSYNQAGNNTGTIPYGALLALKPTIDIRSLGLTEYGLRLAEAIQNYGMYALNGGGCNAPAIDADQHVTYEVRRILRSDIRKIYPHVRMILNNDVLGSPVVGGGTPRAANCAFDAT